MLRDALALARSRDVHLAVAGGLLWGSCPAPRDIAVLGFSGAPLLMLAIDRAVLGDTPWVADARPIRPRAGRTLLLGGLVGFLVNVIVLAWIVPLLQRFAYFPLIAALPVGTLLWGAQGLPFALAACASAQLRARGVPTWFTLPLTITVASTIFPAIFPWHISTSELPWIEWVQLAELGGTPLLDVFLAMSGCALLAGLRERRGWLIALGVSCAVIPPLYGVVRVGQIDALRDAAPRVAVGVIQPGVTIEERMNDRWPVGELIRLRAHTAELEAHGAEVVVWPEAAHPFGMHRATQRDREDELGVLRDGVHGPVLYGVATHDFEGRHYNSVVVMERGGTVGGISDKVVLLAFGEYVPFWDWLPPLQQFFPDRGTSPGDAPRVLMVGGKRVGVLNCYEDVLDGQTRTVARLGPDYLVNATLDAWFEGDEPYLHNAVARFRTIETRRDMVRAVNGGVASHLDAVGRIRHAESPDRPGHFIADVRVLDVVTPWVRYGDWVTPLLCALLAAWCVVLRVKR